MDRLSLKNSWSKFAHNLNNSSIDVISKQRYDKSNSVDNIITWNTLLIKILNPEYRDKNDLFKTSKKYFGRYYKNKWKDSGISMYSTVVPRRKHRGVSLKKSEYGIQTTSTRLFDNIISLKGGKNILKDSKQEEGYNFAFYTKFYTYEMINAIISILSILSITFSFQPTYNPLTNDQPAPYRFLLVFLHLLTVLLWISIACYYYEQYKWETLKQLIPKEIGFMQTFYFKKAIIEILFNIIQPSPLFIGLKYSINPSFTDGLTLYRSINSWLSLFVLPRIYYIDRFWLFQSSFMDYESISICRQHSFEINIKYALIAVIKTKPFHVYFVFVVTMWFVFQYAIKVFESSISIIYQDKWKLDNTVNVIWYCMITVFTVGYGDIVARTDGGRLFITLLSIIGSFWISLFLMSMTNFLIQSPVEKKQFDVWKRIELNEVKVNTAKKVAKEFTNLIKTTRNVKDEIRKLGTITRQLVQSTKKYNGSDISIEHHNWEINNFEFDNVSFAFRYFANEYQDLLKHDKERLKKMSGILESIDMIKNNLLDGQTITEEQSKSSNMSLFENLGNHDIMNRAKSFFLDNDKSILNFNNFSLDDPEWNRKNKEKDNKNSRLMKRNSNDNLNKNVKNDSDTVEPRDNKSNNDDNNNNNINNNNNNNNININNNNESMNIVINSDEERDEDWETIIQSQIDWKFDWNSLNV